MGMDVYKITYEKANGEQLTRPIICEDARGAARAATAIGKKLGWRPLFDTLEVDGVPLSATARNPGHISLQKGLRQFHCVFQDKAGKLTRETIEAFDAGNAKTAARAHAKATDTIPLLKFLKAVPMAKGEVPKGLDRAMQAGGLYPGVQIYQLPLRRHFPFDPENDEMLEFLHG
jgi:hypothetical protein